MLFSIIVPCGKCDTTIARVLDSIVIQNENDLEVILVDDTEDHSFIKIIEPYKVKLDIKVVETTLKYHTPGNSRNTGLELASGEWILFIDSDDSLRENALNIFKTYINKLYNPVYNSKMKSFHSDGSEYTLEEESSMNRIIWMHGKLYNRKFLNECNIRFKPDMIPCEDYYFNYMVLTNLFNLGYTLLEIPEYTYNYMWNDNSLTRSNYDYKYLSKHMYAHLESTLVPWTKIHNPKNVQASFDMFMYFLITNYFFLQYYKKQNLTYSLQIIQNALSCAYSCFHVNILDIINCVESNYDLYDKSYKAVIDFTNENFVCQLSFRDWMLNMYK